ncbi:glycoside hydrolase family 28 protein [Paenibacillus sp. FSL H8-0457]|uniref:glycoside hydrolase family 28 protein n=1 Tax=unclassified Paenibacillus TaxID=185978 RepID=UPI0001787FD5|nr:MULTISPECIES: glycoside hydrolase family 28 protein [unclassified Paenibacillus]ACX65101.1 glycoside hydrolase family 28 [Paenibacillus sp. Y412MC10]ETT62228.1 glycoside hydrolase family protein [Paenibacillus sp. FSL H8-457]
MIMITEEAICPDLPVIPEHTVTITDYGAVGDGVYDNTQAFHQAIEACAKAGGGTLVIPPGIWLTGPIKLQSRIELHASAGAFVMFSKFFEDYPILMSTYEGRQMFRCQSPLDGEGLEDVAITGGGIFDGSGEAWRPVKRGKLTESQWERLIQSGGVVDDQGLWWPTPAARDGQETLDRIEQTGSEEPQDYEPVRDYLRPNLLSLRNCKRILLSGPTFQNSAAWCLHPWASEQITIQNITVRNPWYAQNGDGLDIDSCKYVTVENSSFDVGDDAICLKSGKNEAGRLLGKPSERISIRNCTVYHGHGGIVVGSEMSGGIKDVYVSDCTFIGTDIGIRFKSCRGRGGVVENILIERIRMRDIDGDAISFNLYYEGKAGSGEYQEEVMLPVTEETPVFRNIVIQDIVCSGAHTALLINGLPEMPVENLTVKRSAITSREGIVCRNGQNLSIQDLVLRTQDNPLLLFHQSRNVQVANVSGEGGSQDDRLLVVTGERSSQIECSGLKADKARGIEISPEVEPGEVVIK